MSCNGRCDGCKIRDKRLDALHAEVAKLKVEKEELVTAYNTFFASKPRSAKEDTAFSVMEKYLRRKDV